MSPFLFPIFAGALGLAASASAQSPLPLLGKWEAKDRSSTVVIAPCTTGQDLCATVVAERLKPSEPSSLNQVVVRDIRFDRRKGWRALFVDGGANYPASAKMKGNDALAFKVCVMAFLCDTQSFVRVR